MGTFINRASGGAFDPNLLAWLQAAAAQSGYNVILQSGMREGDPRYHGKGMAADIRLVDPATGKEIPNYQNAGGFNAYQEFANLVRGAQMTANPDMANQLRWGGYFSGDKTKYGALDTMHFDLGGAETPMGGGGWDTGLTDAQAAIWGLKTGGGYTGAAGGGASPVASTMSSALAPLVSDYAAGLDPWNAVTGMANKRGGYGGEGEAGGLRDSGNAAGIPVLETPSAVPPTMPTAAPAGEISPLASLFKLREIGKAGQAMPLTGRTW